MAEASSTTSGQSSKGKRPAYQVVSGQSDAEMQLLSTIESTPIEYWLEEFKQYVINSPDADLTLFWDKFFSLNVDLDLCIKAALEVLPRSKQLVQVQRVISLASLRKQQSEDLIISAFEWYRDNDLRAEVPVGMKGIESSWDITTTSDGLVATYNKAQKSFKDRVGMIRTIYNRWNRTVSQAIPVEYQSGRYGHNFLEKFREFVKICTYENAWGSGGSPGILPPIIKRRRPARMYTFGNRLTAADLEEAIKVLTSEQTADKASKTPKDTNTAASNKLTEGASKAALNKSSTTGQITNPGGKPLITYGRQNPASSAGNILEQTAPIMSSLAKQTPKFITSHHMQGSLSPLKTSVGVKTFLSQGNVSDSESNANTIDQDDTIEQHDTIEQEDEPERVPEDDQSVAINLRSTSLVCRDFAYDRDNVQQLQQQQTEQTKATTTSPQPQSTVINTLKRKASSALEDMASELHNPHDIRFYARVPEHRCLGVLKNSRLTTMSAELDATEANYSHTQTKLTSIQREKDNIQVLYEDACEKTKGIKRDLDKANTEISSLRKELWKTDADLKETMRKLEIEVYECNKISKQNERSERDRARLGKKITEFEKKGEHDASLIDDATGDYEQLYQILKDLIRRKESVDEQLIAVNKQMVQTHSDYEQRLQLSKQQIQSSENLIKSLGNDLIETRKNWRNSLDSVCGLSAEPCYWVLAQLGLHMKTMEIRSTARSFPTADLETSSISNYKPKLIRDVAKICRITLKLRLLLEHANLERFEGYMQRITDVWYTFQTPEAIAGPERQAIFPLLMGLVARVVRMHWDNFRVHQTAVWLALRLGCSLLSYAPADYIVKDLDFILEPTTDNVVLANAYNDFNRLYVGLTNDGGFSKGYLQIPDRQHEDVLGLTCSSEIQKEFTVLVVALPNQQVHIEARLDQGIQIWHGTSTNCAFFGMRLKWWITLANIESSGWLIDRSLGHNIKEWVTTHELLKPVPKDFIDWR